MLSWPSLQCQGENMITSLKTRGMLKSFILMNFGFILAQPLVTSKKFWLHNFTHKICATLGLSTHANIIMKSAPGQINDGEIQPWVIMLISNESPKSPCYTIFFLQLPCFEQPKYVVSLSEFKSITFLVRNISLE